MEGKENSFLIDCKNCSGGYEQEHINQMFCSGKCEAEYFLQGRNSDISQNEKIILWEGII